MDEPLSSQYQQRLCRLLHSLWSCKNFESSIFCGPRGIKPTMIFFYVSKWSSLNIQIMSWSMFELTLVNYVQEVSYWQDKWLAHHMFSPIFLLFNELTNVNFVKQSVIYTLFCIRSKSIYPFHSWSFLICLFNFSKYSLQSLKNSL